jgi:hypothetical protein
MRVVQSFLSSDSLKLIYYSYFHSILTYRIIFWVNTHYSNAIFKMQKRIIRIMVEIRNRDSCREYFKRLKILPLQSQYLLSLLLFVADNGDYFRSNSEIHSFDTKNKLNCIHHFQNWQCSRGDHIILELRPSIICLRTFSRLKNNSNKPWNNSYISTHSTA